MGVGWRFKALVRHWYRTNRSKKEKVHWRDDKVKFSSYLDPQHYAVLSAAQDKQHIIGPIMLENETGLTNTLHSVEHS